MSTKQTIKLNRTERQTLLTIVRTGTRKAKEILHAHILLKSAAGWTDAQVSEAFDVSPDTVRRIRLRYLNLNLTAAIQEQSRSGPPVQLTSEQETRLIALVCSQPPVGYRRWTIRLLATEAIDRKFIPSITYETVRQLLKKTKSSRG
jgi:hypothetical protein